MKTPNYLGSLAPQFANFTLPDDSHPGWDRLIDACAVDAACDAAQLAMDEESQMNRLDQACNSEA